VLVPVDVMLDVRLFDCVLEGVAAVLRDAVIE